MERLAALNLADPNPPAVVKYLLLSHPPIIDRVDHAREFARDHDLPVPEPVAAD
jgi:STE24 endopeptidase